MPINSNINRLIPINLSNIRTSAVLRYVFICWCGKGREREERGSFVVGLLIVHKTTVQFFFFASGRSMSTRVSATNANVYPPSPSRTVTGDVVAFASFAYFSFKNYRYKWNMAHNFINSGTFSRFSYFLYVSVLSQRRQLHANTKNRNKQTFNKKI